MSSTNKLAQYRPAPGSFGEGVLRGVRASWPLAVAVGAFGVSYGLLATTTGFGGLAAFVMSLTTFSGASQFASLSVLASGGGVTAAVVAAALLAARYGPIGISVAPSITGNAILRFLQAQLIIDESWAVSNRGDGTVDRDMLLGAGGLIFIAWAVGTVIGVFGGDIFRDPEALGLDAAFPALFLGLLLSQINGRRAVVAALLGGLIAFALIPFAKAGIPIIAASAAALVGLRRE